MRTANDLNLRAQRLVDVLGTSKEFVEEMLRENERLHRNLGLMENAIKRAEAENREFATRHVEMEQQGSNLANLYVASHQLHSTLDFKEVLQIVQEIVINFIGSECFAVLMADEATGEFQVIAAEGVTNVVTDFGPLAGVIASGESYFAPSAGDQPLAAIPLKIKDRVIGLLVIYQLLEQKRSFSTMDYELFSLLAGQAATAIFSAKLYSDAERKLNTIQGFIDSLTTA
jgi:transcriptional regulator with GAF, ATPase, and Fis domain